MGRIRSIKPEFFTSDSVARLSIRARLTWIGLWTYVDDGGCGDGRIRVIHGALYPVDDQTNVEDLERDLVELEKYKRIIRYEVAGKPYVAITNWSEHQKINRPSRSVFPPPDPPFMYDSRTTHAPELGTGAGNRELEQGIRERARRGTRLPDDWAPDENLISWQRTHGFADPWAKRETEKFCNFWWAKPGPGALKLDWRKTWMNWLLKAAEDAPHRNGRSVVEPTPSPPPAKDVLAALEARCD